MAVLDAVFKITASVIGANAVKSLSNDIKSASTAGDNFKRSMAQGALALKAFAGSMVVREFGVFIQNQINTADNFNDISQKTGVAVESLSRYSVAAQNSGIDINTLAGGFNKLNKAIIESKNQSSNAAAAFKELKIDPLGKNADQITAEVADQFKNMEDGAAKATIAMALFGKSGADLIPMLNMGSEEIGRFNQKIDQEFATAADNFNDKIGIMRSKANGFGVDIAKTMLPALSDALTSIDELFQTGNTATQFGKIMGDGFRAVTVGLAFMTKAVKDTIAVIGGLGTASYGFWQIADGNLKGGLETLKASAGVTAEFAKNQKEFDDVLARSVNNSYSLGDGGAGQKAADAKANPKGTKTKSNYDPEALKESASNFKAAGKAAEEFLRTQREGLTTLKQESDYIGLTAIEVAKLTDARKFDVDVASKMKDMSTSQIEKFKAQTDAIKEQRQAILQLNYDQSRTFGAGAREFFTKYAEDATNTAEQVKNVFGNAFKGAEDALVEFATTGKLNFKSFASSVIKDLIRINVQRNITSVISTALGSVFGAAFGGATASASYATAAGRGALNPALYGPGFASGGDHMGGLRIVGERGPELEATGPSRIYNAQQTKNILSGAGGGSQQNNISVSVNVTSGESDTQSSSQQGANIGNLIANVVKSTLINEKRPGGLLA